jgi:hypothetical protein
VTPFPKDGRLESVVYVAWVRRQPCIGCGARYRDVPVDAHHVGGKKMGGARCMDDEAVPLCRLHHDECHRMRIPVETQERWADETLRRFLREASASERKQYFRDLERWVESRVFVVPV